VKSDVVAFPGVVRLHPQRVRDRLEQIASIFAAIEAGELLAALPECAFAKEDHKAALKLLAFVEVEINALCAEL
jgi:hypothetical protein